MAHVSESINRLPLEFQLGLNSKGLGWEVIPEANSTGNPHHTPPLPAPEIAAHSSCQPLSGLIICLGAHAVTRAWQAGMWVADRAAGPEWRSFVVPNLVGCRHGPHPVQLWHHAAGGFRARFDTGNQCSRILRQARPHGMHKHFFHLLVLFMGCCAIGPDSRWKSSVRPLINPHALGQVAGAFSLGILPCRGNDGGCCRMARLWIP